MGPGMPESTEIPLALRVKADAVPVGATPVGDKKKLDGLKCHCTRYSLGYVIVSDKLHLEPAPDGTRHGKIEAEVIVYDREGQTLNWLLRQENLAAGTTENGVHFSFEIDVPEGGFYLRSGVYDWGSSLSGTLEIPIINVVHDPPTTASDSVSKR